MMMLSLIADVGSLDFSCGSNFSICLREDISEMEAAARKFEMEAGVLDEINHQARSSDDLYMSELFNVFQRVDEDEYSPYCEIKFELSCELSRRTTHGQSQQQEHPSCMVTMLNSGAINSSPEVSEISTSCVASTLCSLAEPLEGSTERANVSYSSLLILAILCVDFSCR